MTDMAETILQELYQSLDQRWRPEETAEKIRVLLGDGVDRNTAAQLKKVSRHSRPFGWSSMIADFARPVGMGRQLHRAQLLFGTAAPPDDLHVVGIREYQEAISAQIAKGSGRSDFREDRLNREQRGER